MTDTIERMVDGVTVRKSFETDEFPVPAVTFEIESAREDPVKVTITDDIPDPVAMEQIGFHPDYHNDEWTAYPEGRVEFTHEFDSRESITTIYGVRLDDDDSQEAFLRDPQISIERLEEEQAAAVVESGEPDTNDEGGDDGEVTVSDPDRTNVVREVIEGERDTVPGLGDDADEQVAEVNGGDPADEVTAEGSIQPDSTGTEDSLETDDELTGADESPESTIEDTEPIVAETDDTTKGEPSPGSESMAAALADEIRAGNVDDDDLATLKQELGSDQSTETRLGHLQSRVSDLEAYSQAIEEFIDEHGSAQQLLRSVEDDLTTLANRVDELESTTEQAASDRQSLRGDVSDVADQVSAIEADIDDVAGDVDRLQEELNAVRGDVAEVDQDVEEVRDEVSAVDEEVQHVREDVEDRLESTVADLEDDLDSLQSDVQDLREWRSQLTDVFGAGGSEE
ncbi:MAG: hypothetical protein ABEJ57_04905 [Halobacteriaceae archaeon]